jgi:hypothetical protein
MLKKKIDFRGLKKNSIKFFSTDVIRKNFTEILTAVNTWGAGDFSLADLPRDLPIYIGVAVAGGAFGIGVTYVICSYFFGDPNKKPESGLKPEGGLELKQKLINKNLTFNPHDDFPGFTTNGFCEAGSHKAHIDGVPLINQRTFVKKFYEWIERNNLTDEPNWHVFYDTLYSVYAKSLIFERSRDLNDHIILDLEAKFGVLLDGINDIDSFELTEANKISLIDDWLQIVLNDSDISFVLGELTKNSMPMCFTLLYFFFLIYNISKKYLIFYWIKSNFLLKFYTFRLFFKL